MPNSSRDDFMAWERSFEGIAYRLNLYPFVEDDDKAAVIIAVCQQLPEEIRDYVYARCRFVWSADWGRTWPGDLFADKWVITLHPDLPAQEAPGVVAHEIAHAYLGHRVDTAPASCEVDAAALAKFWGFTG
jgi:hypothetical protein